MLIKVKTLTGKEIEVDIEPLDKVIRIKERLEEKEGMYCILLCFIVLYFIVFYCIVLYCILIYYIHQ